MYIPKLVTFLQVLCAYDAAETRHRRYRMTSTLLVPALIIAMTIAAESAAQPSAPSDDVAADLTPITREGALQRADSLYLQLDLDHDGIVTRGEAIRATTQLREQRKTTGKDVAPGIGSHTARFMMRRFAGAQSITRQQFEQAMLAHFNEMDLDHDGILSIGERQRARDAKSSGQ